MACDSVLNVDESEGASLQFEVQYYDPCEEATLVPPNFGGSDFTVGKGDSWDVDWINPLQITPVGCDDYPVETTIKAQPGVNFGTISIREAGDTQIGITLAPDANLGVFHFILESCLTYENGLKTICTEGEQITVTVNDICADLNASWKLNITDWQSDIALIANFGQPAEHEVDFTGFITYDRVLGA